MKNLAIFFNLMISLFAFNAAAYGLNCTTASQEIKSLTLDRDGGEETVSISYHNQPAEKYLVLQHSNDGKVVAIEDNAITGGTSNKGLALVYNATTGKGYIAHKGEILTVACTSK